MENLNDAEFGSEKSGEEAPILVAQRYLNIFRQVHIFNKAKRDAFDDELLALPTQVTDFFKRMPGGRLLVEHIEEVKTERGISFVKSNKEDFEQSSGNAGATNGEVSLAAGTPIVGGNLVIDASFAETLAKSLAAAFKQTGMGAASGGAPVNLGGAFDVIAEEIRSSRTSLLDILKETRSVTDSVIASQVSISRILEGLLSSRKRDENDLASLNNRIIASQTSITKLLESLYTSNNKRNDEISDYLNIENKLESFRNEIKDELNSSLATMQEMFKEYAKSIADQKVIIETKEASKPFVPMATLPQQGAVRQTNDSNKSQSEKKEQMQTSDVSLQHPAREEQPVHFSPVARNADDTFATTAELSEEDHTPFLEETRKKKKKKKKNRDAAGIVGTDTSSRAFSQQSNEPLVRSFEKQQDMMQRPVSAARGEEPNKEQARPSIAQPRNEAHFQQKKEEQRFETRKQNAERPNNKNANLGAVLKEKAAGFGESLSKAVPSAFNGVIRNKIFKHEDNFSNVQPNVPPLDETPMDRKSAGFSDTPSMQQRPSATEERYDAPIFEQSSLKEDLNSNKVSTVHTSADTVNTDDFNSFDDFADDDLSFELPAAKEKHIESATNEVSHLAETRLDDFETDDGLSFELPKEVKPQNIPVADDMQHLPENDFGSLDEFEADDGLGFTLPTSSQAKEPLASMKEATVPDDDFSALDDFATDDDLDFSLPEKEIERNEQPIEHSLQASESDFDNLDDFAEHLGVSDEVSFEQQNAEEALLTQDTSPLLSEQAKEQESFSAKENNNTAVEQHLENLSSFINEPDTSSVRSEDEGLSSSEHPSRYSMELDRIRKALTTDNIDISSLDEPIALDEYSDDENLADDDTEAPLASETTAAQYSTQTGDNMAATSENEEEWEWEYVDENGNPMTENGSDEDWEWEYVEDNTEDGSSNPSDNNK